MFQNARQMVSGRTALLLWRVGKRYRVQSRFLVVIDCYRAGMNQSNIVRTNNTLVWWTKMTLSTFRSQRFLSEKNQDRTNYALLRAKDSRKTCTSTRTHHTHPYKYHHPQDDTLVPPVPFTRVLARLIGLDFQFQQDPISPSSGSQLWYITLLLTKSWGLVRRSSWNLKKISTRKMRICLLHVLSQQKTNMKNIEHARRAEDLV